MKKNMHLIDRIVRVMLVALVGVLYATGTIGGTLAIVLGVVAAIFLLTSLVGSCPLYTVLGIRTNKTSSKENAAA